MAEEDGEGREPRLGGAAPETRPGRTASALVGAAAVIAGLYFARPVLEPLALSVLLSLMLAPAVRRLQHWGLGRVAAVALAVFLASAVILGFAAAVGDEALNFVQNLPQYESNIAGKIRSLNGAVPSSGVLGRATHVFRDLGNEIAGLTPAPAAAPRGAAAPPLPVVVRNGEPATWQILSEIVGPLLLPIASAGLVVLFVVMILLKREDLRDRLLRLAGERDLNRTTAAMNEAAERVSRYLLMQLAVGVCYGLPIGVGLAAIGIPNALLWGLLGVLMRFLPYLGGPLTGVLPVILSIAVAPGWGVFLWTLLLFAGVELVIANLVEPWLYGRSTGLSAVAVMAAAVFWTWLWGMVGLLLATPLTVCLVVLGRHVPHLHFLEILLGNQPVLSPAESLYQRLLARDPEEATEQAEEFARQNSIEVFFDEVAIPALQMAQTDDDRGALSPRHRAIVAEGLAAMLDNLAEDRVLDAAMPEAEGLGREADAIVCLAGRNELDLAAAWLLQHALLRRGHRSTVFSPDALATFKLERLPLRGSYAVCLSLLSASSAARARYLVRRIRRQARRARLVIGCWGERGTDFSVEQAVAATAADQVVTSLAAAVAAIEAALPHDEPAAADRLPEQLDRRSA